MPTGSGTLRPAAAVPEPAGAVAGQAGGPPGHTAGTRRLAEALAAVEAATAGVVVDEVPVPAAARLVAALAHCERMVGALRVHLVHRVTAAGGHRASGERDAAGYSARVSGASVGRARAELALAERLGTLPEVAAAHRAGRISTERAQVVAEAAVANPSAGTRLLRLAEAGSFAELRDDAARARRAVRSEDDERERERRVHARRYCRTYPGRDGGLRIDALLADVGGARLLAALTKRTDQLLQSSTEPVERLRADALVDLVCGEGVRTELVVRADAAALVRGAVEGEEVCEVGGVGPVSVTTARALLGEAFVTLLVTDGADVKTVTSTTRVIPRRVRKALAERDRCCVVPGCGATLHLEIDHWRVDFARGGLTSLDNLCKLCRVHHTMKTQGLLHLGGGPGRWFVTTPAGAWAGPRPP